MPNLKSIDVWVWSCAINMALVLAPTKRVVWFAERDYSAFLANRHLDPSFDNLMAWAADAVAQQALAHSSDQPATV